MCVLPIRAQLNVIKNDSTIIYVKTKYAWPVTVSGHVNINLGGITGINTAGGVTSDYKTVRMDQTLQTMIGSNEFFHCCNLSSDPTNYIKFWLGTKEKAILTLKDILPLFKKKASDFPIQVTDANGNEFYIEYPKHREDVGKFVALRPKNINGFCILSKKHVNNMITFMKNDMDSNR